MSEGKYIPFPMYWDDVPIDLSFIYEGEKPAGKHGFLTVKGDKFVFEDGTEGRFWGTNFNSGGNFPPFEYSEKVAKRLAKIGVNLVRFHQLDAEWATPNIFQFAKGKRRGDTRDLDPESMKRLDYLIHRLKGEGIYIYLDMLTYRKFKSGDGVENAVALADAAKPYSIFNRRLIELQKEFCRQVWNHVNPYTGLAYKDDPAIILTEITNECDMFSRPIDVEPYRTELEELYRQWLAGKGQSRPEGKVDFSIKDEMMLKFLMEIQERYYREMTAYMRGIGVKIPVAGTNWSINAANRRTQLVTDFADGHAYWYAWKWGEKTKEFQNKPMVGEADTILPDLSFSRFLDKPYFVSEWDDPWPNEWRAESPLFLAAVGALQGWSGFAIHTYTYSTMTNVNITGKEVSSSSIGSVPYREGVFNTWNDPAKFGLFYHAALMFRRGDIKPSRRSIGVRINDMALDSGRIPALSLISEIYRVGLEFPEQQSQAGNVIAWDKPAADREKGEVISDTGELYRNWKKRIGWIDTEKSKTAYGFLGQAGKITLDSMEIDAKTDFAIVALSSLTDAPISQSENMFLLTIGRSKNTNMRFNEAHTEMLDVGKPPILIEVIEAGIRIKTEAENLRVWAVNAEGFFAGVVPSEYRDGTLSFKVGERFPSIYYLIQAE
ncbi:MAG: hypothetical protein ACM3WV_05185 [Bacillota bacterium]